MEQSSSVAVTSTYGNQARRGSGDRNVLRPQVKNILFGGFIGTSNSNIQRENSSDGSRELHVPPTHAIPKPKSATRRNGEKPNVPSLRTAEANAAYSASVSPSASTTATAAATPTVTESSSSSAAQQQSTSDVSPYSDEQLMRFVQEQYESEESSYPFLGGGVMRSQSRSRTPMSQLTSPLRGPDSVTSPISETEKTRLVEEMKLIQRRRVLSEAQKSELLQKALHMDTSKCALASLEEANAAEKERSQSRFGITELQVREERAGGGAGAGEFTPAGSCVSQNSARFSTSHGIGGMKELGEGSVGENDGDQDGEYDNNGLNTNSSDNFSLFSFTESPERFSRSRVKTDMGCADDPQDAVEEGSASLQKMEEEVERCRSRMLQKASTAMTPVASCIQLQQQLNEQQLQQQEPEPLLSPQRPPAKKPHRYGSGGFGSSGNGGSSGSGSSSTVNRGSRAASTLLSPNSTNNSKTTGTTPRAAGSSAGAGAGVASNNSRFSFLAVDEMQELDVAGADEAEAELNGGALSSVRSKHSLGPGNASFSEPRQPNSARGRSGGGMVSASSTASTVQLINNIAQAGLVAPPNKPSDPHYVEYSPQNMLVKHGQVPRPSGNSDNNSAGARVSGIGSRPQSSDDLLGNTSVSVSDIGFGMDFSASSGGISFDNTDAAKMMDKTAVAQNGSSGGGEVRQSQTSFISGSSGGGEGDGDGMLSASSTLGLTGISLGVTSGKGAASAMARSEVSGASQDGEAHNRNDSGMTAASSTSMCLSISSSGSSAVKSESGLSKQMSHTSASDNAAVRTLSSTSSASKKHSNGILSANTTCKTLSSGGASTSDSSSAGEGGGSAGTQGAFAAGTEASNDSNATLQTKVSEGAGAPALVGRSPLRSVTSYLDDLLASEAVSKAGSLRDLGRKFSAPATPAAKGGRVVGKGFDSASRCGSGDGEEQQQDDGDGVGSGGYGSAVVCSLSSENLSKLEQQEELGHTKTKTKTKHSRTKAKDAPAQPPAEVIADPPLQQKMAQQVERLRLGREKDLANVMAAARGKGNKAVKGLQGVHPLVYEELYKSPCRYTDANWAATGGSSSSDAGRTDSLDESFFSDRGLQDSQQRQSAAVDIVGLYGHTRRSNVPPVGGAHHPPGTTANRSTSAKGGDGSSTPSGSSTGSGDTYASLLFSSTAPPVVPGNSAMAVSAEFDAILRDDSKDEHDGLPANSAKTWQKRTEDDAAEGVGDGQSGALSPCSSHSSVSTRYLMYGTKPNSTNSSYYDQGSRMSSFNLDSRRNSFGLNFNDLASRNRSRMGSSDAEDDVHTYRSEADDGNDADCEATMAKKHSGGSHGQTEANTNANAHANAKGNAEVVNAPLERTLDSTCSSASENMDEFDASGPVGQLLPAIQRRSIDAGAHVAVGLGGKVTGAAGGTGLGSVRRHSLSSIDQVEKHGQIAADSRMQHLFQVENRRQQQQLPQRPRSHSDADHSTGKGIKTSHSTPRLASLSAHAGSRNSSELKTAASVGTGLRGSQDRSVSTSGSLFRDSKIGREIVVGGKGQRGGAGAGAGRVDTQVVLDPGRRMDDSAVGLFRKQQELMGLSHSKVADQHHFDGSGSVGTTTLIGGGMNTGTLSSHSGNRTSVSSLTDGTYSNTIMNSTLMKSGAPMDGTLMRRSHVIRNSHSSEAGAHDHHPHAGYQASAKVQSAGVDKNHDNALFPSIQKGPMPGRDGSAGVVGQPDRIHALRQAANAGHYIGLKMAAAGAAAAAPVSSAMPVGGGAGIGHAAPNTKRFTKVGAAAVGGTAAITEDSSGGKPRNFVIV